jgi:hypothetical protein
VSNGAYKLLGFLVWNGGKWYLRRRLPSPRRVAIGGLLAGGALTAAALLAWRAASG